jgi:hypothetical protein
MRSFFVLRLEELVLFAVAIFASKTQLISHTELIIPDFDMRVKIYFDTRVKSQTAFLLAEWAV